MLIGLFGVAIVPLLAAYWLYESSRSGTPWATTNRGELMTPAVTVANLDVRPIDGDASMANSGRWWLAVVANDGCAADCRSAVHQLRQLHILLGKDAARVMRSVIRLGEAQRDAALAAEYPDLEWFSSASPELRPGVYIIDPLGNVVLRYAYRDAGKPVLEDLKQLLKVSHIG